MQALQTEADRCGGVQLIRRMERRHKSAAADVLGDALHTILNGAPVRREAEYRVPTGAGACFIFLIMSSKAITGRQEADAQRTHRRLLQY